MKTLALALLVCLPALAQTCKLVPNPLTGDLVCGGGSGSTVSSYTVATLPLSAVTGTLAVVTDAATAGSCSSGSGSALSLCRWSGSAWVTVGDGSGTVINTYLVSTLPASPATNTIAFVTDASPAGSCTVGSGTGRSVCQYSGSAWVPIGSVIDGAQITIGTVAAARLPAALSATTSVNGTPIPASTTLVPATTTVNGHALSSNVTVTAGDLGVVPTTTTVNGHALSANVTVTAADTGAAASNASTTVNGTPCVLGSTCSVTGLAGPAPDGSQVYGVGGNTTLAATVAAAGNNGAVLLPTGTAISLSSAVTISQTNLHLKCEAGATITKAANITMLIVTGSGVSIEGCTFDGAKASFTGKGVTIGSGAAHVTIARSTFQNMDTSSIYMNGGVSDVQVYDNHISPWNSSGAINLDGAGTDINIHDNWCDSSNEASFHKCIQAHATSGGNTISKLSIVNNHMLNGEGYCVEVGKFGGDAVQNVVIANNTCNQATLVANGGKGAFGGYGGYSIDSAVDVVISNNTYRNETATSTDNPGLELIGTRYNATGNVIYGSYATMNRLVDSTFANNQVTQTFTDNPALLVEIQPGATTQPPSSSRNKIEGNTFLLVNGGVDGVYQTCNTGTTGDAVSFCNDNVYIGNVVYDVAGTATGAAFRNAGVKGTELSTLYAHNKIVNWNAGTCYNLSPNSTGSRFLDNSEGCATLGSTVATQASYYRGTKAAWTIGDAITNAGGSLTFTTVATPTTATLVAITSGGTLADSTSFCYRVAAINANGTTLASTEACATTGVSTGANSVYVYWPKVLGATGYNVYGRTTAAELLMTATALAYNVNTFIDTGSVTPSGALPGANTTLGSISGVSNVNGFYPPTGMGTLGYVLTSAGAGAPASFQAQTGLARPNLRESSYMAAGNTTLVGSGESFTVTGTASNAGLDSVGNAPMSINFVTAAATSGTVAGLTGKTSTKETRNPLYQAWVQLPASGDFVVTRAWVTWGNSTFNTNAAGSDTPAGTFVGFRASTVASDTNWQCVANVTSGTQTTIDSGIPINTTGHSFEVSVVASTSITWKIGGVQVCTTANNATGTAAMAVVIQNITQENVVKNIRVAYEYWEQDVP